MYLVVRSLVAKFFLFCNSLLLVILLTTNLSFPPSTITILQMLHKIPKAESLKETMERSRVYWEGVIQPALQEGKTLLVVGHENNLRSLIMQLEGISKDDIINLSLPRAVPLAYRLDTNLQPLDRPDGKLDEATGFLRGTWIGGDAAVKEILDRDHKQVYDTSIQENLEMNTPKRDKYKQWADVLSSKSSRNNNADEQRGRTVTGRMPHLGEQKPVPKASMASQ